MFVRAKRPKMTVKNMEEEEKVENNDKIASEKINKCAKRKKKEEIN